MLEKTSMKHLGQIYLYDAGNVKVQCEACLVMRCCVDELSQRGYGVSGGTQDSELDADGNSGSRSQSQNTEVTSSPP